MYAYGGDANLDGKINIDDYGRIDFGLSGANNSAVRKGWFNGDFNYDGIIDIQDYGIIDASLGFQGAPFSTADSIAAAQRVAGEGFAGTGLSTVPEPATLSVLIPLAAGLLSRRRRRVAR